jgi:hypothetical protein
MATSRRKFIKAGAIGALFAGIPLKAVAREFFEPAAGALTTNNGTVGILNMQAFGQHLNSEFRIHHNNAKITSVKLVEVKDLRSRSATNTRGSDSKECFSAVFVGARRPDLRQDTNAIEHASLGKFSLLLVPVGMNKNAQYYEAIFNRLH